MPDESTERVVRAVPEPRIVLAGSGTDVGLGRVMLDAVGSGGALAIIEMRARPGVVVPSHIHRDAEELFYLLEGRLTVRVGDAETDVGPGDLVVVPRRTLHAHRNDAAVPTRWLTLFAPAGTEGYFAERAHHAAEPTPGVELDYAGLDPRIHDELRERFGIEVAAERERSSPIGDRADTLDRR